MHVTKAHSRSVTSPLVREESNDKLLINHYISKYFKFLIHVLISYVSKSYFRNVLLSTQHKIILLFSFVKDVS